MPDAIRKSRLAVVSPFVDKRHGTERRVTEWISQLAATYEIHIYSQNVQDLDLTRVTWHRIPKLPGPHLAKLPMVVCREPLCGAPGISASEIYDQISYTVPESTAWMQT